MPGGRPGFAGALYFLTDSRFRIHRRALPAAFFRILRPRLRPLFCCGIGDPFYPRREDRCAVVKTFPNGKRGNRLLNLLPPGEFREVEAILAAVTFKAGEVLYELH